jgi:type VII secretion-associated serine protease mycosin
MIDGLPRAAVWLVVLCTSLAAGADPIADGQWFNTNLSATQAHAFSTGNGVIVAVVDSGVDASHSDLKGSVVPGFDLSASGDGRVDTNGHGTAMAGLIVAHGRVAGIAPSAVVMPVRISATEHASSDYLAQGIRLAAQNSARVISVSVAAPSDDLLLRQVVEDAIARDVVVVAGVGNRPEHQGVQWPAAIPGVVAVAGVDRNGNHSKVSVSGPEVVLAAPSDDISSTNAGGGYRVGTGTSDATAIVAGAVALVRSRFPQMKAPEVIRRLTATAIDKGPPGRDNDYGYGIVNLVGALTADLPTEAASTKATTNARARKGPIPLVAYRAPRRGGRRGANVRDMAQATYDEIADWYAEYVGGEAGPFGERVNGLLETLLGNGYRRVRGYRVRHRRTGTNDPAPRLAPRRRGRVDATAKHANHLKVTGDATRLPIKDAIADAVTCILCHTDVPDYRAVIKEASRIGKGVFVHIGVHPAFTGAFADRTDPARVVVDATYHRRERRWDSFTPKGVRAKVGAWHTPLDELLNAFVDAGWAIAKVHESSDEGALPDLLGVKAYKAWTS